MLTCEGIKNCVRYPSKPLIRSNFPLSHLELVMSKPPWHHKRDRILSPSTCCFKWNVGESGTSIIKRMTERTDRDSTGDERQRGRQDKETDGCWNKSVLAVSEDSSGVQDKIKKKRGRTFPNHWSFSIHYYNLHVHIVSQYGHVCVRTMVPSTGIRDAEDWRQTPLPVLLYPHRQQRVALCECRPHWNNSLTSGVEIFAWTNYLYLFWWNNGLSELATFSTI